MEQFVNRDPTSSVLEYRLKSPLQMAIDRSGINGASRNVVDNNTNSVISTEDYLATHSSGTPWRYDVIPENLQNMPANQGAPGTVMQQDILSKIGGMISVRGDTFKIRCYGSTKNPVTGNVDAEAWCEVIIQRRGDYVDPETADADDADGFDTPDELPGDLSVINNFFGRRFEVIRFRWLSPDEV